MKFGTTIISETIDRVDFSSRPFKIWPEGADSEQYVLAESIVVATGATAKRVWF